MGSVPWTLRDPGCLAVVEVVCPIVEDFMNDVRSFPWGGDLVLSLLLLEAEDEVTNVELTHPDASALVLA